jgi:hypothetical protein
MFEEISERNLGFEGLIEVVPNVAIFWVWRRVVCMRTDVSEKRITSIFLVGNQPSSLCEWLNIIQVSSSYELYVNIGIFYTVSAEEQKKDY